MLRTLRADNGFMLMELLVAIVAGVVVLGALYAIFDVSLRQTTRLSNETAANQDGRTAMAKIIEELHSTCLSPGSTPVQPGSTPSTLIFVSATGASAVLPGAQKHELSWSESARTLTDAVYENTSGSWPEFKFEGSSPTSTTQVATHIKKYESGGEAKPIFAYYRYAEAASGVEGESGPATTLAEITPPAGGFDAAEAATVSAVKVSFDAAATTASQGLERSIPLSNEVTFAFSIPNSETPIHDAPCQ